MRTAAQLEGLPLNRSTLALLPDALVLTGRTRLLEPVRRALSLHEVSRVETFDAEEPVNLRVWTATDAWRLHVNGPVVWRFAIEDALRRLGRDLPSMGSFREPGARLPSGSRLAPDPAARVAAPTQRPGVQGSPQVGDIVPLRLTIELPGGVCVEVRLLGEIESVRSNHPGERHPGERRPAASPVASSGGADVRDYVPPGDGHARDLPRLDVHL